MENSIAQLKKKNKKKFDIKERMYLLRYKPYSKLIIYKRHLISKKCIEKNCKRYIEFGGPYCKFHLKKLKHIKIDLENGKGLYAFNPKDNDKIIFYEGDLIGKIKGSEKNYDEILDRYTQLGYAHYIIPFDNNKYIDTTNNFRYMSLINYVDNIKEANCEYDYGSIYAIKNIFHGEELKLYTNVKDFTDGKKGISSFKKMELSKIKKLNNETIKKNHELIQKKENYIKRPRGRPRVNFKYNNKEFENEDYYDNNLGKEDREKQFRKLFI